MGRHGGLERSQSKATRAARSSVPFRDAGGKCLLGIISRKIQITRESKTPVTTLNQNFARSRESSMSTNDPKSSITPPSPSQRAEQSTLFGRRRTERGPRRSPDAERPVSNRIQANKIHPALKHAGYSATTLLPGEDPEAFEQLHESLIDDYRPVGAHQKHIVADLAHLMWRKQIFRPFGLRSWLEGVVIKFIMRRRVCLCYFLMAWIRLSGKQDTDLLRSRPDKNW
jgi:hypothetical protein